MNKMNFKGLMLALAGVLAMALVSCSGTDEALQSSIPADSWVVMNINGEKLLKALGAQKKDGAMTLPQEVEAALGVKSDFDMTTMAELAKSVSFKNLYCVIANNGKPYLTFLVEDADAFRSVLTTKMGYKESSAKGFDAMYSRGSSVALVRDKQCWLVGDGADKAVSFVTKQLSNAGVAAFTDVPTISTKMAEGDDMMNIAVNMTAMSNSAVTAVTPAKQRWTLMEGEVKDDALRLESGTYDGQGNLIKTQGMQTIAMDFLRYLPSDFNCVVAMGLTPAFDWSQLTQALEATGGVQMVGALEMLKPMLKSVNGTIALGCAIPSKADMEKMDENDYSALRFMAMVRLDQAGVASMTELVSGFFKPLPVEEVATGLYCATIDDNTHFYYGMVDGYFAVSSIPMKADAANSLTQTFQGKSFAGYMSMKSLSDIVPGIDYGINATCEGSDDEAVFIVRPENTKLPVMAAVIKLIMAL